MILLPLISRIFRAACGVGVALVLAGGPAQGGTLSLRPVYLRVADSLERVRPALAPIQKARIWLDKAEQLRRFDEAGSYACILSAFRITIGEKNDSLKAFCHIGIGDYHNARRRYMKAHEHYLAAWQICRFTRDTLGEIRALINISMINRHLRSHEKALSYLQKARMLTEKQHDAILEGRLNEQFALVYQAMGDVETSQHFFRLALDRYQGAGDRQLSFRIRSDAGSLLLDERRYEEALAYFRQLLQEADTSDRDTYSSLLTRISHVYDVWHDNRTSLKYNKKALQVRLRDHAMPQVNSSLINIAGDYYKMGQADSGRIYMDSGLVMARRSDRFNLMENGYRHLYQYYLQQNDPKQALEYYGRYAAMRDAINLERNRDHIGILEANQKLYHLRQSGEMMARQRSIHALNLKYHDNQRWILEILMALAGLSTIVLVLISLYFRNVRRKMQEMNVLLSEEIRDRETAEEQTREREAQYKFITDNSLDVITHFDDQRKWLYISPSAKTMYGYEPEESFAMAPEDFVHPDDHQETRTKYRECMQQRLPQQFVFRATRKDGGIFWAESVLIPLFDPVSGAFKGMVGVTRDIQERKTKELQIMEGTQQKENLLKEIHHRVKNNFSILVSLINMQMAQTHDQELLQSLTNLQLRIRTMALVHEMLYRSGDFEKISFSGYLRSLTSVIAGTYNRKNIGLNLEADEVVMDIETLIPLGLIVNEILSNAFKHAFPEGHTGTITIRFHREATTGINTLTIKDNGVGLPGGTDPAGFKTMGLQVVQILCTQIEATLHLVNDPGASFTIAFRSKGG